MQPCSSILLVEINSFYSSDLTLFPQFKCYSRPPLIFYWVTEFQCDASIVSIISWPPKIDKFNVNLSFRGENSWWYCFVRTAIEQHQPDIDEEHQCRLFLVCINYHQAHVTTKTQSEPSVVAWIVGGLLCLVGAPIDNYLHMLTEGE